MLSSLLPSRTRSRRRFLAAGAAQLLEPRRLLSAFQVTTLADETVANDGLLSLREALTAANQSAGADTVTFAPSLTSGGPATILLSKGQLVINSDVTITGPGASRLTIDAQRTSRVLAVQSSAATLSGLTITRGHVVNERGGGIQNAGTLTINQCVISANSSQFGGTNSGGGDIDNSGTLVVRQTTFSHNGCDGGGAAIGNLRSGTVTATQCAFTSNIAEADGAVENFGTATLVQCTVTGTGTQGSALTNYNTMTVSQCTISGNNAGGINSNDNFQSATLNVTNCTIANNVSLFGGAGISANGTVTVVNTTISGNTTGFTGSGIDAAGTFTLKNSIVAGNGVQDPLSDSRDVNGTFSSASSFNLIGRIDGSTGITNGVNGNKAGTASAPLNAQLGALADNGGPTQTMSIPTTSPAFNAGSNANVPSSVGVDQRGLTRVVNGVVDIGAFENQTVTPVTLNTSTAAYVRDGSSAGTNFGNTTDLQVKIDAAGYNRDSYVKFDLTSVSSIANAKLRIFGGLGDANTPSISLGVYSASSNWSESTLTFNNKPARIAQVATKTIAGTTKKSYDIDVTSYLASEKALGHNLVTLVLHSNTNTSTLASFNSDDASGNRPQLIITPRVTELVTTATSTFVRDGSSADTNFGSDLNLEVKKQSTGVNREAWLKFDISSFATVSSAKLHVFGRLLDSNTASVVLRAFSAVSTTWDETTITFNNKPVTGATALGSVTVSGTTAKGYDIDVTNFVKAEKAAGHSLVTLVLRSTTTTGTLAQFNSDEASGNRPQLVVTT